MQDMHLAHMQPVRQGMSCLPVHQLRGAGFMCLLWARLENGAYIIASISQPIEAAQQMCAGMTCVRIAKKFFSSHDLGS